MYQIGFREGAEQAWANIVAFVPKLLAFLLIVIIGYFVAKIIERIVARVLQRLGLDRAVERGGLHRALAKTPYEASQLLGRIAFYAVALFVLQLAFGVFGPNPVSELLQGVIAYLPKIFAALIIVVVAAAIGAAVREILDAVLGALAYGTILANAAGIAILAIGVFAALVQLEIAPQIITGLFYALLAIVAGSLVVAIGGSGIVPLQRKWEEALRRLETDVHRVKAEPTEPGERVRERLEARREQVEEVVGEEPDTQ